MGLNVIIAILLAATVGQITYLLTRRQARQQVDLVGHELAEARTALSTAKADFDARQEELRNSISEARERENEAKTKVAEAEQRYTDTSAELKLVLQEKGQFQNEATRVTETKALLLERDTQLQSPSRCGHSWRWLYEQRPARLHSTDPSVSWPTGRSRPRPIHALVAFRGIGSSGRQNTPRHWLRFVGRSRKYELLRQVG